MLRRAGQLAMTEKNNGYSRVALEQFVLCACMTVYFSALHLPISYLIIVRDLIHKIRDPERFGPVEEDRAHITP
jgi:hypothetical protein